MYLLIYLQQLKSMNGDKKLERKIGKELKKIIYLTKDEIEASNEKLEKAMEEDEDGRIILKELKDDMKKSLSEGVKK